MHTGEYFRWHLCVKFLFYVLRRFVEEDMQINLNFNVDL